MVSCTNSSCTPPGDAAQFSIRNGEVMLPCETTGIVKTSEGILTQEGLNDIYHYLDRLGHYYWCSYVMPTGFDAQTERGSWGKRFANAIYKARGEKVPSSILTQIGVMVANHSKGAELTTLVTRDFNRTPRQLGHAGSCLWGSEYSTRCMLKSNGAFALLTYSAGRTITQPQFQRGVDAQGRIWVMPLKLRAGLKPGTRSERALQPTFNTTNPDAYALFNGYGTLSDYQGARILSAMSGYSYGKINLEVGGMYINSPNAYLVMKPELADDYKPDVDGVPRWVKYDTRTHANLYAFEEAEWMEALGDEPQIQQEAIAAIVDLTSDEKERQRRERYNQRRREQRAQMALAAAIDRANPNAGIDILEGAERG